MSFVDFMLYDMILFFIKLVIVLFIYRFFVKKKCNILSDIADKQIKDYFDSYDDDFVDSINILDEPKEQANSQTPTQF